VRKRLIVTGAGGFVGGVVVSQVGDDWEPHALARREIAGGPAGIHRHCLDLLDFARLRDTFRRNSVGERLVTLPINPRQTREALDYLIESVRAMSARRF